MLRFRAPRATFSHGSMSWSSRVRRTLVAEGFPVRSVAELRQYSTVQPSRPCGTLQLLRPHGTLQPLDCMGRCSSSDRMKRYSIEHCNFFDKLDARGLSAAALFRFPEFKLAAPSARYVAQISEGAGEEKGGRLTRRKAVREKGRGPLCSAALCV